jgi:hypothetical protein
LIPIEKQVKKKTVLVLIPTLGERLDMLRNCLTSIFLHECDLRVVVIFPRRNYENMLAIKKQFPQVILEDQDLKLIPAVNYVIQKNDDCEYFTWINDDDALANNCIQRGLSELELNLKIIGTYGAIEYIDQNGREIGRWNPPRFAHSVNFFIPSAVKAEGSLFRMSVIQKIGEIPSFVHASVGDIYLITRAVQIGKLKKLSGLPVAKFRIHDDSLTTHSPFKVNLTAHKLQLKLGSTLQRIFITVLGPIFIFAKLMVLKVMFFKAKVHF